MKEKLTTLEMIARIAGETGISKKVSNDLIRVLPDLVAAGLEHDGEVRIPGLGTFRLKWVETRTARNLKTGAEVTVPAHSKVVFLPEKALKEQVNGDFRYLTYQVLEKDSRQSSVVSQPEEPAISEKPGEITAEATSVTHGEPDEVAETAKPFTPSEPKEIPLPAVPFDLDRPGTVKEPPEEEPVIRKRKLIYWVIPLLFVIITLLVVVFYMKNCREPFSFTVKEKQPQEQVIQPSVPATQPIHPVVHDTSLQQESDSLATVPPAQSAGTAEEPVQPGFPGREFQVTGGRHLFQIAREVYGNPYLWALVYKENIDKIPDPEQLLSGTMLLVPSLEGTPDRLSRADSLRVAEGYRMLVDYYSASDPERAREFKWAVSRYSPE